MADAADQQALRECRRGLTPPLCTPHRFAPALFCKPLLEPALFARLEIKAIFLDVFADSFSLYLAAEASHGLFEGFVFAYINEDQGCSLMG